MRSGTRNIVGLDMVGLPQSALEAVTSLDPRDYQYGQPSPAQQAEVLQQIHLLANCGAPAAGGQAPRPEAPRTRAASLHLDVEVDCLKLLVVEEEQFSAHASASERSAATGEGRVRGRGAPPSSPPESSSQRRAEAWPHRDDLQESQDDEDEADLLLSDPCTMRRVSSFMQLAECGAAAEALLPPPPLKLSMDYAAACATINTALCMERKGGGSSGQAPAAAAPCASATRLEGAAAAVELGALPRQASLKRRRS